MLVGIDVVAVVIVGMVKFRLNGIGIIMANCWPLSILTGGSLDND